jgi:opacity protein-like surface antigen
MNEQWINDLRQKMTDYEWPVPEVSWDEIDQAVAANKAHKARLLWLRRMAAAAVVLLIAGVGYWSLMRNDAEPIQPTTVSVSNQQLDENHALGSAALLSKEPVPMILAKSAHTPNMTSTPVLESETASPIPTAAPDTAKTITTTATNEKEQPQPVEEKKVKPADKTSPVIYPSDLHQRKNLDNRLTAKVYVSSTMAGNLAGSFRQQGNPSDLIITDSMINCHVSHRQPVRFGVSLRYRINDCWSVESGLTYTHLSSDITTTIENNTCTTEQRLNYIGLPMNISYDLWKGRNFGLYISAGGMIEKSLDTSSWQFSLNGAAGAEYKLTDFLSLYAEPGLGYYFKDGSITPTIYQDHPLNFNLSFGLRFNLK